MEINDKSKLIRRLQIIEGQVRAIKEMVQNNTYCINVITQTSAIKQGLSNVEDLLLADHLSHCVVNQVKSGNSEKVVEEVIQVYKLKRK